jgi:hypothetical protein
MGNNPVKMIDPDGGNAFAPIYDPDGNFLGTDDQGLQGKAIVMNAKNFTQGMSHTEALGYSLGSKGMNEGGLDRLLEHKAGLSERPDWDGIVTVAEAQNWREIGNGQPLFVDISQMRFNTSALTVRDFGDNDQMFVNFYNVFNIHADNENVLWRPASDRTLSRVYGTVRVVLINRENGTITLAQRENGSFDSYDFAGWRAWIAGAGDNFDFFGYGTARIRLSHSAEAQGN